MMCEVIMRPKCYKKCSRMFVLFRFYKNLHTRYAELTKCVFFYVIINLKGPILTNWNSLKVRFTTFPFYYFSKMFRVIELLDGPEVHFKFRNSSHNI